MDERQPQRSGSRLTVKVWLAVAAFWIFVAVLYASQLWWLASLSGERINLRSAFIWQGTYYLAWIPFTALVWRATRGWLPEALGWPRWLARHLALATAVAAAHTTAVVAIALAFVREPDPFSRILLGTFRGRFHLQVLIYAAVVAVGQALELYDRYRERRIAAAELEAELAAARLDALRTQLQPHFLFNSLHAVASLARAGDNAGVVRLIAGLSELLRHVLESNGRHQSLRDEVRLVDQYLDIQRVRFGDRLTTTVTLDPDAASARVPPLIVQPLVENAFRHGFGPRVEPGHVSVRARADSAWTTIEVEDDGAGLPEGWNIACSNGTGLKNLASRLIAEFGEHHTLAVESRSGGGVRATVRIPYVNLEP